MHELAVTESILEIALRHSGEAGAQRITDLHLVIGELSTIIDESVQFYWDFVSEGTPADARLQRRGYLYRDCQRLANTDVNFRHGSTTDRSTLEELELGQADHVMVLACSDDFDAQRADARTLVTLLHLREINDGLEPGFSIVSEMVDERSRRLAEVDASENYSLAMACTRIPNSIVCLLSALRVHGVGSQSPAAVWLAIPHKARAPRMPMLNLRLVRFSTNAWTSGIQDTTFEGVPARITTPARTIADCFRFERLIGSEAPMEALRDALDQRIVTIAELAQAVKQFPSRRLAAVLDSRSL